MEIKALKTFSMGRSVIKRGAGLETVNFKPTDREIKEFQDRGFLSKPVAEKSSAEKKPPAATPPAAVPPAAVPPAPARSGRSERNGD